MNSSYFLELPVSPTYDRSHSRKSVFKALFCERAFLRAFSMRVAFALNVIFLVTGIVYTRVVYFSILRNSCSPVLRAWGRGVFRRLFDVIFDFGSGFDVIHEQGNALTAFIFFGDSAQLRKFR